MQMLGLNLMINHYGPMALALMLTYQHWI